MRWRLTSPQRRVLELLAETEGSVSSEDVIRLRLTGNEGPSEGLAIASETLDALDWLLGHALVSADVHRMSLGPHGAVLEREYLITDAGRAALAEGADG